MSHALLFRFLALLALFGRALPAAPEPAPAIAAPAALRLSADSVDFGRVPPLHLVTREVTLTNHGSTPALIADLGSTCECATVVPGQPDLAPGESTTLLVRFDSRSATGPVEHHVALRFDDPDSPVLTIAVRAEVVPTFTVSPPDWNLGLVSRGGDYSREIVFEFADARRFLGLETEVNWLQVKPLPPAADEAAPGRRHRFLLRLTEEVPGGYFEGVARLRFAKADGTEAETAHYRVFGDIVRRDLYLTPAYFAFVELEAGESRRDAFELRSLRGQTFSILEVKDVPPGIEVAVRTVGPTSHLLEMQVDASSFTRPDVALLRVLTDHPSEQEVRVPIVFTPRN